MGDDTLRYELYYWPDIPGRGEFIRLVLEEANADYLDVGRQSEQQGGGIPAIVEVLEDAGQTPAFAPPVLKADDLVISQTANICLYLAKRHDLISSDETHQLHANQLQLTIQDFLQEAHGTHHPLGVEMYYEDQKDAALEAADDFLSDRVPKYFRYFEKAVQSSDGSYLLGKDMTYVDLSMFHMLRGLEYAFPNSFESRKHDIPGLLELKKKVSEKPDVREYLASDRCMDFNEDGIFRHYEELDEEPTL